MCAATPVASSLFEDPSIDLCVAGSAKDIGRTGGQT